MKRNLSDPACIHDARIRATKMLLTACRSQLQGKNPSLTLAFAEHAESLREHLQALEKTAALRTHSDRSEASAAVAAHAGGIDQ